MEQEREMWLTGGGQGCATTVEESRRGSPLPTPVLPSKYTNRCCMKGTGQKSGAEIQQNGFDPLVPDSDRSTETFGEKATPQPLNRVPHVQEKLRGE